MTVARASSKRSTDITIAYGVLMLQAMTTPFAVASAVRPPAGQPAWLGGLYLVADLAALAALGMLARGRQTHHDRARFAPALLVLPVWAILAAVSPLFHDTVGASAMYSLYALVVGAVSSIPFVTRDALSFFAARPAAAGGRNPGLTSGPIA